MRFTLERVHYMPKQLQQGKLYFSEEYETAAHLCACGCGAKVRTPLCSTEWSLTESAKGPSLYPSIGNWQLPCRSHYWIKDGAVIWSDQWSEEEIQLGRQLEERRRQAYYSKPVSTPNREGFFEWLWKTIRDFLK